MEGLSETGIETLALRPYPAESSQKMTQSQSTATLILFFTLIKAKLTNSFLWVNLYIYNKCQTVDHKMFGKLKNFISHAVTSLNSQRPRPPSDPQLESKLKFLLDYILRNST